MLTDLPSNSGLFHPISIETELILKQTEHFSSKKLPSSVLKPGTNERSLSSNRLSKYTCKSMGNSIGKLYFQ